MSADSAEATDGNAAAPKWQAVSAVDRRVLGVLIEKAKTTPDAYPLSLNGLVTGANQKNNRHPVTQYEPHHIEESLERLRRLGAIAAVQGGGRVEKYRHYLYEWLGVEKVELSVMAELLLRGPQTEGELRGRAARMDPIPDLSTLRTILESLKSKGLVQALTPEGRGQIITHNLYTPDELSRLRQQHGGGHQAPPAGPATYAAATHAAPSRAETSHAAPELSADLPRGMTASPQPAHAAIGSAASAGATAAEVAALRREIEDLRTRVAELSTELADIAAASQRNADELDQLRQALGG